MLSWVGNPGRPPYVIPRGSAGLKKKQEPASLGANHRQGNTNKAKANARSHVLRVPVREGRRRPSLETWDTEGNVHKLPFMVSLREELRLQMWSIHTRYDCARKVLAHHKDLQALPEKQIRGALQKIWCDWTFSGKKTRKEAYKAISQENAHRMIDTTEMLLHDRREAYQSGRLSV